jgi:uncharacterized peroxidase-related enzyme
MTDSAVHPLLGIEWLPPVVPEARHSELEARAKKLTGGAVPRVIRHTASLEWLGRATLDMLAPKLSHADPDLFHLIGLVASHANACRYCYGTTRAMLRVRGYDSETIERLEHDLQLADLSDDRRAVLDFARLLARSNPRPARAQLDALASCGLAWPAITEIAAVCAIWCMGNRIATFLAVPPETRLEGVTESFVGKLLRPLLASRIRKSIQRLPPPGAVGPVDVPFGALVTALGDTHVAVLFRDALQGAFSSPVLSTRAKLLAIAVVARSLACDLCEGESRRVLAAEGAGAGVVDEVLAHLASPSLDAVESAVVRYARDTVHFRMPAQIQARTRALVDEIGADRALEAVGVAALGNGIVRLAMIRS